jgi:MFS family permease
MSQTKNDSAGMVAFTIAWLGQVVSLLGTAMSNFALTLWAYEVTGQATPLALVGFFFVTPIVLLGPLVGVLVDRGNRKLMMALSDLSAALVALIVLALYMTGGLQIWHLYLTATISGIFQGFGSLGFRVERPYMGVLQSSESAIAFKVKVKALK